MVTGSVRNDNKALAGADSKAFDRWLHMHHRYAPIELPSAGGGHTVCRAILEIVSVSGETLDHHA